MNTYLEEFPPDTEGQETAPLPADEIMDIIYHSMPTTWKYKIIETGFDYVDSIVKEMTDFFETRLENLEPKESSVATRKSKDKKSTKKRKQADSNSSIVESIKEFSVEPKTVKKYCILNGKCSHLCYGEQAYAEKIEEFEITQREQQRT